MQLHLNSRSSHHLEGRAVSQGGDGTPAMGYVEGYASIGAVKKERDIVYVFRLLSPEYYIDLGLA